MKFIYSLLVVAALMLSVSLAYAVPVERINVTWGFDTQSVPHYEPTQVALFVDGNLLCDGVATSALYEQQFECLNLDIEPGERSFTITVMMANGSWTPHSLPYVVNIPIPDPKAPTIIEFYLKVTIDGQVYEFSK